MSNSDGPLWAAYIAGWAALGAAIGAAIAISILLYKLFSGDLRIRKHIAAAFRRMAPSLSAAVSARWAAADRGRRNRQTQRLHRRYRQDRYHAYGLADQSIPTIVRFGSYRDGLGKEIYNVEVTTDGSLTESDRYARITSKSAQWMRSRHLPQRSPRSRPWASYS